MKEGDTYRCSWSPTTTGYRLWVVSNPELARENTSFSEAAQELAYAVLDKTGDGEAQFEFEPPAPDAQLHPPALLQLWELGFQDIVRYGNAHDIYVGACVTTA